MLLTHRALSCSSCPRIARAGASTFNIAPRRPLRIAALAPRCRVVAESDDGAADGRAAAPLQRSLPSVPPLQISEATALTLTTWALAALPAAAIDAPAGAPPASSYYVSLGLFVITLPGLWSLIKRAPKAKIKRKTFEVEGPGVQGAVPLDTRAKQIFSYFKNYNYTVKGSGEVITFEGRYQASLSQAAALVLYTFISLGSTALVLSIAAPWGGNLWYLMTLISPAAGAYYLKNANRTEEFKVKMVTSDDDKTTDILVEGDEEEIDRLRRELGLVEKGMEYVKGILER